MSFFGAFFLGLCGISKVVEEARIGKETRDGKRKAIENGYDTYYDGKGTQRELKTGKQVGYKRNNMGDRMLVYTDGSIAKRFDDPYKQKRINDLNEEMKKHNVPLTYAYRYGDKYSGSNIKWHRVVPNTAILKDSSGNEYFAVPYTPYPHFINVQNGERVWLGDYDLNDVQKEWIKRFERKSLQYKENFGKYDLDIQYESTWIKKI